MNIKEKFEDFKAKHIQDDPRSEAVKQFSKGTDCGLIVAGIGLLIAYPISKFMDFMTYRFKK